ncbi:hypothetical protein HQQ80_21685 [Microbacteriaceae bacterium VKM Ac-2855]|nr:hypothetical protein [Microbacteriaceae bacterium VKM Ac-2855]
MTDLTALRFSFHARIRLAADARKAARTKPTTCAHTWERFRQTVAVEIAGFEGRAWFVVMGCCEWRAKRYVDYVVER